MTARYNETPVRIKVNIGLPHPLRVVRGFTGNNDVFI
jgi:hypothetical protein